MLYRYTPGGYGYYRSLREFKDPNYIHDRDKHTIRAKHHGADGWQSNGDDGIIYRDYTDYEEYVVHQSVKLDEMLKIGGGFSNATIKEYRLKFYRRFRELKRILDKDADILCLGARQGTEVEVLRDLGFARSTGIDLNPGPRNNLVLKGNFLKLDSPSNSIDLVYSNAIDHALNLEEFFLEHARVIKPNGYALYDIPLSAGGPSEAVQWDSATRIIDLMLHHFGDIVRVNTEQHWKWILLSGKKLKRQAPR